MQRNFFTKLKRQSIRNYFSERCAGGPKSTDVWPIVKRFLSNKGFLKDPITIFSEIDNIITDQLSVAGTINEFYLNVAEDITSDPIPENVVNHPNIQTITVHTLAPIAFDFSPASFVCIGTFISKSNSRKASGVDGIPAKMINVCSNTISEQSRAAYLNKICFRNYRGGGQPLHLRA